MATSVRFKTTSPTEQHHQSVKSEKVGCSLFALIARFFSWLFGSTKTIDELKQQTSSAPPAAARSTTDKTEEVGTRINKIVAPRGKRHSPDYGRSATAPKTSPQGSPEGSPKASPVATATKADAPQAQKSPSTNPSPTGSPKVKPAAAPKTELTPAQQELLRDIEQIAFKAEVLINKCKQNLNGTLLTEIHNTIREMEVKNETLKNEKWGNIIQAAWADYRPLYTNWIELPEPQKHLAELQEIIEGFETEGVKSEKLARGHELLSSLKALGKKAFTQEEITKIQDYSRVLSSKTNASLRENDNSMKNYRNELLKAQKLLNSATVKAELAEYGKKEPNYVKAANQIRSANVNDPKSMFTKDLPAKRLMVYVHSDHHPTRRAEAEQLFTAVKNAAEAIAK